MTCDAFRRVLRRRQRRAGWCPSTTPTRWRPALIEVLDDDEARQRYVDAAAEAVRRYDWSVVERQIMRVYETVAGAGAKVQVAGSAGWGPRQQARAWHARAQGTTGGSE